MRRPPLDALWYPPRPEGGGGLGRRLALLPLGGLSWLFGAAVSVRSALFSARLLPVKRVEGVRVVSVGNLVVGGAGKTPAVAFLALRALRAGKRVVVLSRGYGRTSREDRTFHASEASALTSDEVGDEPLMLARRCPGLRFGIGADRERLLRRVLEEAPVDLALLDDGFQHRRLWRDEDLVVLDGAAGLGNGRLLPRGPLREPPSALSRTTLVWWREPTLPGVREAVVPFLPPGCPWVRVRHRPGMVVVGGSERPAAWLAGQRVLAFAGLARPGGFLASVDALGAERVSTRLVGDHARYGPDLLASLEEEARRHEALLLTTEKDAMRLPRDFPAAVLRQEVDLLEGEASLDRALGLWDNAGACRPS